VLALAGMVVLSAIVEGIRRISARRRRAAVREDRPGQPETASPPNDSGRLGESGAPAAAAGSPGRSH
jgi:hypothetical protein